ncbi:MAG: hypothetical protein RLZZ40_240 [Actinomycetota bacterium]|jgi:leucyl aminopeptidase
MTTLAHSTKLVTADTLAVYATKNEKGGWATELDGSLHDAVVDAITKLKFEPAIDAALTVPAPAGSPFSAIVIVGLPDGSGIIDPLRYAAGTAARNGHGSLALAFPTSSVSDASQVLEGAALATVPAFTRKSGPKPKSASKITVVSAHKANVADITARVDAVKIVRDLVTEVPNVLSPAELAKRVVSASRGTGLSVEVLDEKKLAAGKYGGILGIGAGSSRPPRMVVVRYKPRGAKRHIALVGKGITFDTGGLSIKPAASMVGMKYDMTGAATVFAVIRAAAALKLPIEITARLCIAENMPSGTAIRPNDVVTIRGGKTVEVTNTDAEGRVVLADGLVASSEEKPDVIVDVATLTGAARTALGDRITGVMGDPSVAALLSIASSKTGDEVWTMPLPNYLRPVLASDVADIANAKVGHTAAGMLIGGIFLREFVGKRKDGSPIPWAHLDIAGPANNGSAAYGYTPKGATGTMVRTLIEFLSDVSNTPVK